MPDFRRAGSVMRTVADVMIAPAPTVESDTTLQVTSTAMLDAGTHAVVIVEGGRLFGVATAADIARALADGRDATQTPVAVVARASGAPVRADEALAEVHQRMRSAGHAVLAVTDRRNKPVGLLIDPEASDTVP